LIVRAARRRVFSPSITHGPRIKRGSSPPNDTDPIRRILRDAFPDLAEGEVVVFLEGIEGTLYAGDGRLVTRIVKFTKPLGKRLLNRIEAVAVRMGRRQGDFARASPCGL